MSKLVIAIIVVFLAACSRESTSSQHGSNPPTAALPAGMTRVTDPSQVCMVNDQFMGRAQIPIEIGGRTYYGCCAMCKDRLNKQPAVRVARDPVSGEQVDKSDGADPSGRDRKGDVLRKRGHPSSISWITDRTHRAERKDAFEDPRIPPVRSGRLLEEQRTIDIAADRGSHTDADHGHPQDDG